MCRHPLGHLLPWSLGASSDAISGSQSLRRDSGCCAFRRTTCGGGDCAAQKIDLRHVSHVSLGLFEGEPLHTHVFVVPDGLPDTLVLWRGQVADAATQGRLCFVEAASALDLLV